MNKYLFILFIIVSPLQICDLGAMKRRMYERYMAEYAKKENVLLWINEAEGFRISGDINNAIKLYDKVISFESELHEKSGAYFVACAGLAEIYRWQENFVVAMEYYSKIVNSYECRNQRCGIYVDAHYWLGDMYRIGVDGIARNIRKAIQSYMIVINTYDFFNSDNVDGHNDDILQNISDAYIWTKIWVGQLYFEQRKYTEAKGFFEQVFDMPNIHLAYPAPYLWALEGLGSCELRIGSKKKAIMYFQNALRYPNARTLYSEVLVSIEESIQEYGLDLGR